MSRALLLFHPVPVVTWPSMSKRIVNGWLAASAA